MRKVVAGILIAAIAGLLIWVYRARHAESAEQEERDRPIKNPAQVSRTAGGEALIKLDRETQERIGLKTQALERASQRPEVTAYGRLEEDPSRTFVLRAPVAGTLRMARGHDWPGLGQNLEDGAIVGSIEPRISPVDRVSLTERLATAQAEVEASRAALAAARAAFERARILNADNKNVSDRVLQESEARMTAEQARQVAATQTAKVIEASLREAGGSATLAVDRGGQVAEILAQPGEAVESGQPILRLARFDRLLARVDIPAGESIDQPVATARIVPLGRGDRPFQAERIALAATVDPKTQGQAFLFRVADPRFVLRPGMAVTAYLNLPGAPRQGVIVPRSALVRHAGKVWAYLQAGAEQFARREIAQEDLTQTGWFTRSLSPGDRVVLVGAQTLLSEEFKSQIQVGEENP